MSTINVPKRLSSHGDKENCSLNQPAKQLKSDLKEPYEFHHTNGKLEEDQMEEEMLAIKRKRNPQSIQNFSITLVSC